MASTGSEEMVCATVGDETRSWPLHKVTFRSGGAVGSLMGDTGASGCIVSKEFVERAKLEVSAETGGGVKLADGSTRPMVGRVDLPVSVQVLVEIEGGMLVHWDRGFTLKNVVVADLGPSPPRDLYVSYSGFATGPLHELVKMIELGARVLDTPRVPKAGEVLQPLQVEVLAASVGPVAGHEPVGVKPAGKGLPAARTATLRERIESKIPLEMREHKQAKRMIEGLLARAKLFGDVDTSDLTETVEFKLKPGAQPKVVSFKVPLRNGVTAEEAARGLARW